MTNMTLRSSRLDITRYFKWALPCAVLMIGAGVFVFAPVFAAGFWTDDYTFAAFAARLPLVQYLVQYFDPSQQNSWYRPFQGMLWWLEYQALGSDPSGYHIVSVGIHIANCLLLLAIVARLTRKWWIGFVAGLAFLSLPSVAIDVFWPGVADPQLVFSYLATIWFWHVFLVKGSRWAFVGAFIFFVSTLLTKEMGAPLILIMFLFDRLLVNTPSTLKELVQRYALFAGVMIPYALIEYNLQIRGVYVTFVTYGTGGNPVENLAHYLLWLTFPWSPGTLANWIAAVLVVGALLYWGGLKRHRGVLFLSLGGVISILPVVPFPFALERYLYLPAIFSVAFLALSFEFVRVCFTHPVWRMVVIPGLFVFFFVWNSGSVSDGALNYSEFARQTRLQFRPIFQSHPTFPADTMLYFIAPPFPTPNIAGMMFLHYGANVSVYGTDRDHVARLRDHGSSFIFYQDNSIWREVRVNRENDVDSTPPKPIQFEKGISLVDFELANSRLGRGEPIVVLLFWQTAAKVDRDYTVYFHLVNAQGQAVTGFDSQPRQGQAPTSTWRPNTLMPDGVVVPMEETSSSGEYRLEFGLYDSATMQRLSVLGANGQPISDKVVIAPITVEDPLVR